MYSIVQFFKELVFKTRLKSSNGVILYPQKLPVMQQLYVLEFSAKMIINNVTWILLVNWHLNPHCYQIYCRNRTAHTVECNSKHT